jgi:hypothetical protein
VSLADIVDNLRRGIGAAERVGEAMAALARGTLTDPVTTWTSVLGTLASVGRFTALPDGPLSPLMTERGTTYHFAAFDLPFASLRSAAKLRDCSVNDAFMAAVGLGLERYHVRRGSVADDLRFNVPISLRGDAGDTSAQASNAVTIARIALPVAGLTVEERMHGKAIGHAVRHPAQLVGVDRFPLGGHEPYALPEPSSAVGRQQPAGHAHEVRLQMQLRLE